MVSSSDGLRCPNVHRLADVRDAEPLFCDHSNHPERDTGVKITALSSYQTPSKVNYPPIKVFVDIGPLQAITRVARQQLLHKTVKI